MNSSQETITIKDTTGNPAPLGLLGFSLTTILLNLHNAGHFSLNTTILAMGIFVGGIAQVIAGIMEWKKGSTFGMTAFIGYGFFWMTLVGIILMPRFNMGDAADAHSMAAFLILWGIFSFGMFIGTFTMNRALQFVFGSLVVLFFLLAVGDITGNGAIKTIAGYEGIICGLSALYTALAQILNEVYGKVILPICPVKKG